MNIQVEFVEALQSKFAVEHVKDNVKVNLSQMAEPFGKSKRPSNWLKSSETKAYIKALSDATKIASTDLLIVRKGGNLQYQGTWCTDYKIALRYAQWLSPEFSVAVDTLLLGMISKQFIEKKESKASFNNMSKRLESCYLQPPEYNEEIDVIKSAIMACGSANKLAERIGMNPSILTFIKSRPWLVSSEKLKGIVRACRNLLARDANFDTETFEELLMIDDSDLRLSLFGKFKRGGLI